MKIVLALIRKLQVFSRMRASDKLLLIEAALLTAIARIVIISMPFKSYRNYIGHYCKETLYELDINSYRTIKRIAWAVTTISKYTPWESKCLVQAMTAQRMLKRRKLYSTLYLGVSKSERNGMQAHAWLRCGKLYVTGGQNKNEFKEVARFANELDYKRLV